MSARANVIGIFHHGGKIQCSASTIISVTAAWDVVRQMIRIALAGLLLILAMPAAAGEEMTVSLPKPMLGTWCVEKDDMEGMDMLRCAPGSPKWMIRMTPRAMDSKDDHCDVKSVVTVSVTSWRVTVVCKAAPDRRYNWTFSRDGEILRLAQFGTFTVEPKK
jgi:hypothetical protein